MALPFGLDVSRWDGLLNYDQLAKYSETVEPVIFMAYRATISWGYKDPFFVANFKGAGKQYLRMAYHVVYPAENAQRQVDNLMEQINLAGFDPAHDRLILDAELDHGASRTAITKSIYDHAAMIQGKVGRLPILYARTEWLNRLTYPQNLTHLDLHLAQYLNRAPLAKYAKEHPGPPHPLPTGHTKWLIHQTSDKTPNICAGPLDGKVKDFQDYNRWNGTAMNVYQYFGYSGQPEPEPEPPAPQTVEERLKNLEARVSKLENK